MLAENRKNITASVPVCHACPRYNYPTHISPNVSRRSSCILSASFGRHTSLSYKERLPESSNKVYKISETLSPGQVATQLQNLALMDTTNLERLRHLALTTPRSHHDYFLSEVDADGGL